MGMSNSPSLTPQTVLILGRGAWGSTIAQLVRERGHRVTLWSRYDPTPLSTAAQGAEFIISAVSMSGVRPTIAQLQAIDLSPTTIFVSATKGLDAATDAHDRPLLPSQLWQAAFPQHPVVVLSGPNLAKEIQAGLPAATVLASSNLEAAEALQVALTSPSFRVYTNPDRVGVELGGTLKNVIAIAVGTCDGLHLGTNAKAALVTRGLAEIIRIGAVWGAKSETFYGLSGLGDLLATCNSPLSRNYQVGYALAQNQALDEVLAHLQGTAEGVNTVRVLVQLADRQAVPMPISQQVYALINGDITPQAAVEALMLRDYKPENH